MRLPGGLSEARRLEELRAQVAALAKKVEALDSWRVERPTPSQYAAVSAEVARFVGSLGDTARIISLANGLLVSLRALLTIRESFWRCARPVSSGHLRDSIHSAGV